MSIVEVIVFLMAWIFMCLGFYLLKKSIDSLSRKCYRNCEFTINEDQLQELYDFLRMLEDERNGKR